MKNLYNTTKKLSGKFFKSERSVKDKVGRTIQGEEGQKNKWKEHVEELLDRAAPQNPPDIQPADGDLPINCDEPTMDKILKAKKQVKLGKGAGPDSLPAEAPKSDTETMVKVLQPLFKKIWQEEQVPTELKEGYLIKLPKKGDQLQRDHSTVCTRTSLNRILLNRMKNAVAPQLRDHQAGFHKN
jgi:hypothetical protein